MKTFIWGHRGASAYAPENTMEAFHLAHNMGADGIELDVHPTKDGHLVVAHDETVDRCSDGSGLIVEKTLLELLKLDFSNGMDNYSNIHIPTLEQVLEFIKTSGITVNIEIKSDNIFYEGIEEKALNLVSSMGLQDKVIYSSFNHYSIKLIKMLDQSAKTGVLYSESMIDPHIYAQYLKAEAIHPYFRTLMVPGTIERCKKSGIKIHTWTVNKPDQMSWMFSEGVDAIITNYPDVALKLRDSNEK